MYTHLLQEVGSDVSEVVEPDNGLVGAGAVEPLDYGDDETRDATRGSSVCDQLHEGIGRG